MSVLIKNVSFFLFFFCENECLAWVYDNISLWIGENNENLPLVSDFFFFFFFFFCVVADAHFADWVVFFLFFFGFFFFLGQGTVVNADGKKAQHLLRDFFFFKCFCFFFLNVFVIKKKKKKKKKKERFQADVLCQNGLLLVCVQRLLLFSPLSLSIYIYIPYIYISLFPISNSL